jgi:hypothetical protein
MTHVISLFYAPTTFLINGVGGGNVTVMAGVRESVNKLANEFTLMVISSD